ncbi:hypothetical protein N9A28_02790 [Sulfurimonas sp.]|nr:hypothetical protein [Sulfurimonas sp.]
MKYILLVFLVLFSGCSLKDYDKTQTKVIIIKSPQIKFSDLGYLRNSEDRVELELFIAGKSIQKISINHLVCVSDGCMSKSGFNEEYLNSSYPDELLQNILLSKEIFNGENVVKTDNGFEQNIKNLDVDISYKVSLHVTSFKDRKNKIIFKIKDTNVK